VTSYDLHAGGMSSSTVCQIADRSSRSSLNCSLNDVIWGALDDGTLHWTSTVVSVTLDTSGRDGANRNDPEHADTVQDSLFIVASIKAICFDGWIAVSRPWSYQSSHVCKPIMSPTSQLAVKTTRGQTIPRSLVCVCELTSPPIGCQWFSLSSSWL